MKLEVGQKIGIYEVVRDEDPSESVYPIGSNHLGQPSLYQRGRVEVDLYDPESIHSIPFTYFESEARKVGSLIVKRLK